MPTGTNGRRRDEHCCPAATTPTHTTSSCAPSPPAPHAPRPRAQDGHAQAREPRHRAGRVVDVRDDVGAAGGAHARDRGAPKNDLLLHDDDLLRLHGRALVVPRRRLRLVAGSLLHVHVHLRLAGLRRALLRGVALLRVALRRVALLLLLLRVAGWRCTSGEVNGRAGLRATEGRFRRRSERQVHAAHSRHRLRLARKALAVSAAAKATTLEATPCSARVRPRSETYDLITTHCTWASAARPGARQRWAACTRCPAGTGVPWGHPWRRCAGSVAAKRQGTRCGAAVRSTRLRAGEGPSATGHVRVAPTRR